MAGSDWRRQLAEDVRLWEEALGQLFGPGSPEAEQDEESGEGCHVGTMRPGIR